MSVILGYPFYRNHYVILKTSLTKLTQVQETVILPFDLTLELKVKSFICSSDD